MEKDVSYYIECFNKLKRATRNGEKAPHKLVVILTVIKEIENGNISSTFISPDDSFEEKFLEVWHEYVGVSPNFDDNLYQGFFHLNSEPFWTLISWSPGESLNQCQDLKYLRQVYEGAIIDEELFTLATIKEHRDALKNSLITLIDQSKPQIKILSVEDILASISKPSNSSKKDVKYYIDIFTKIESKEKGSKKTICKLVLLASTIDYILWRKKYAELTEYLPILANWEGLFIKLLEDYLELNRTSTAFSIPFLTLNEDMKWEQVRIEGGRERSDKSRDSMTFLHLVETYEGTTIDKELLDLIQNEQTRNKLSKHLQKLLAPYRLSKKKVKANEVVIPKPFIKTASLEEKDIPIFHPLDWSPFEYGFTIEYKFHEAIFEAVGHYLQRGTGIDITLLFKGDRYDAKITNANRQVKGDTIRLLYRGKKNHLGMRLAQEFPEVYNYIKQFKEAHGGRAQCKLPIDLLRTIKMYKTDKNDVYRIEIE